MSEIRIYVEGGGPGSETLMRNGFNSFLREPHEKARRRRIKWQIIASGSRNQTYKNFCNALKTHTQAINILLVDAEEPVITRGRTWEHLRSRDNWDNPGAAGDLCHLMVCTMEAWFVADREKLAEHFRKHKDEVREYKDVEMLEKSAIESIMARVSRGERHRSYNKITDGTRLLREVRAEIVRSKAWHCDRLLSTLDEIISNSL